VKRDDSLYAQARACLPCLSLPLLCQRASTSRGNRAPVPSWAICASCDLSAYAYTPSGRSPAQLAASWLRFARLTTPVVAALGNSGGVVPGARVHRSAPCAAVGRSRSVHRQSTAVCFVAQFRGGCRYIAASRILPRLAAPEAHRARRLALRHALHSALGLRPRLSPRCARPSLRSAATLPRVPTSLGEATPVLRHTPPAYGHPLYLRGGAFAAHRLIEQEFKPEVAARRKGTNQDEEARKRAARRAE
jgi:hypothetical protein